jgi:hypothetical protein
MVINGGHCDQTERGDREGTMKKIGVLALLVAATPAARTPRRSRTGELPWPAQGSPICSMPNSNRSLIGGF